MPCRSRGPAPLRPDVCRGSRLGGRPAARAAGRSRKWCGRCRRPAPPGRPETAGSCPVVLSPHETSSARICALTTSLGWRDDPSRRITVHGTVRVTGVHEGRPGVCGAAKSSPAAHWDCGPTSTPFRRATRHCPEFAGPGRSKGGGEKDPPELLKPSRCSTQRLIPIVASSASQYPCTPRSARRSRRRSPPREEK
jgi:hypothetical protein